MQTAKVAKNPCVKLCQELDGETRILQIYGAGGACGTASEQTRPHSALASRAPGTQLRGD